MAGINRVILLGNLGRKPEIKSTKDGLTIAIFSMATTERISTHREKTEWHNIVVFGGLAETCEKYLKKGSQVLVEGRLQRREVNSHYSQQIGKLYTTAVVAVNVQFLSGCRNQDKNQKNQASAEADQPAPEHDKVPF